ncbi:hypothetical protein H1R20_g13323, partial [Candolleomyces eurysporus]
MAPSVAEVEKPAQPNPVEVVKAGGKHLVTPDPSYAYAKYVPYGEEVTETHPPLEYFDHVDPGSRANPAKPNLLTPEAKLHHLSPYLGTEVAGIQLSKLSKEGLDELALFVAERKLVIFRDQDLKDTSPDEQLAFTNSAARHFGVPHVHPLPMNVKDYPSLFTTYRDENAQGFATSLTQDKINYLGWHSDISFEKQPAGTTFFYILDGPEVGGDTLYLSTVEAYNRLSPEFKKLLIGLKAVHSAAPFDRVSYAQGSKLRRERVETEHPIVRVHPVTGEKSLYVNSNFTTHIVGFKKEESDALLKFLYDHIAKGADYQVRASYRPGTVAIWDNRVTAHSIVPDFESKLRRHHIRLTPQAEKPIAATEP